jgi:hypothetical protein
VIRCTALFALNFEKSHRGVTIERRRCPVAYKTYQEDCEFEIYKEDLVFGLNREATGHGY